MTKTVKVSEEQYKFLKGLQKQLQNQETDCQASPRFWTIGDYGEEVTVSGNEEYCKIYSPLLGEAFMVNDLIKEVLADKDLSEEDRDELAEVEGDEAILEWMQEHLDENAYLVPLRKVHVIRPNTMFLTKEDAVEHLVRYGYNYTSEAHTYAMTALRSPSVEKLLMLLETIEL